MMWLLWCIWLIAQWAKISFQPLYSDVRFQPTDKLHATCTNSADILFAPQGQKITKFTLVLYYNPENIEILRIVPTTNNGTLTSKVEYNKIILDVENPTFAISTETKSFFQIYFKSNVVGKDTLVLGTWSEFISSDKIYQLSETFSLDFASVPECEPDIIPPSINLVYPKDTTQRITLDQYFIFDIKDIGKWIDKNSVSISFNGKQYASESDNFKRNGTYLTFYPSTWIPIDKKRDLTIKISDNQSYGGANEIETTYSFQSATGMALTQEVNPMLFRKIAQDAARISASPEECALLKNFYDKTEISYKVNIESIVQKVWCDPAILDVWSDISTVAENTKKNTTPVDVQLIQQGNTSVSAFAKLGWILFFITFALKIFYLLAYRKHKKLHEDLKHSLKQ